MFPFHFLCKNENIFKIIFSQWWLPFTTTGKRIFNSLLDVSGCFLWTCANFQKCIQPGDVEVLSKSLGFYFHLNQDLIQLNSQDFIFICHSNRIKESISGVILIIKYILKWYQPLICNNLSNINSKGENNKRKSKYEKQ